MADRICISGSREYKNLHRVDEVIAALPADAIIVHGGARGVDARADQAARRRGLKVEVVRPRWDLYGKAAGPKRNGEMVRSSSFLYAFWDGSSPGTKSAIEAAKSSGVPHKVILDD